MANPWQAHGAGHAPDLLLQGPSHASLAQQVRSPDEAVDPVDPIDLSGAAENGSLHMVGQRHLRRPLRDGLAQS